MHGEAGSGGLEAYETVHASPFPSDWPLRTQSPPDRPHDGAPAAEAEPPWAAALDFAAGTDSWGEALGSALDFTSEAPWPQSLVEGFVLAEQMDHLRGGA